MIEGAPTGAPEEATFYPDGWGNLRTMAEESRKRGEKGPPEPSDRDAGIWRGRKIARRFTSPDGFVVLVGKSAEDNDLLSIHLAEPGDFWFHLAGDSGSHVVVRNPDRIDRLPRATERFAAGLAAGYSKAKNAGRVAVHACRAEDVSQRRGQSPGEVTLERWRSVTVEPLRAEDLAEPGAG